MDNNYRVVGGTKYVGNYPVPKIKFLHLKLSFLSALMVFLFILLFKPYIFIELRFNDLLIVDFIISLIVFIGLIIPYFFYYKKFWLNQDWSLRLDREFLGVNILLITVLLNLIAYPVLINYVNEFRVTFIFAGQVFLYVTIIGVIVHLTIFRNFFFLHVLIENNSTEKKTVISEAPIDVISTNAVSVDVVEIFGRNKNEAYRLDLNRFLYAKSEGHYLKIALKNLINNGVEYIIIRNSLGSLTQQLLSIDVICQCHRSYLINLNFIEEFNSIKGKGKEVKLKFSKNIIPVSKKYFSCLDDYLKKQLI